MSDPQQPSKPGQKPDVAAALAALRAAAPKAAPPAETDERARALASLRALAAPSPAQPDAAASALDALRAAAPAPPAAPAAAAPDPLAAVGAGMGGGGAAAPADEARARALAALRAAAPAGDAAGDAAGSDAAAKALAALRAKAPATPEPAPAAPVAEPAAEPAAEAVPAAGPDDAGFLEDLDALLAGLDADDVDADVPAPEGSGLPGDAGGPPEGPEAVPAPSGAGDAVADALDDLDALLSGAEEDATPDAAAGDDADDLDALLADPAAPVAPAGSGTGTDAPDAADDPLAGLDALLSADGPAPEEAPREETLPDDLMGALEALLAEDDPAPQGTDPLAELDALLDPEAFADPPPAASTPGGPAAAAGAAMQAPLQAPAPGSAAGPAARAAPRREAFGTLSAPAPHPAGLVRPVFRIAVFGDFTGRALRGGVETGAKLAERRMARLDVDTVEEVIESFATTLDLPVGPEGSPIRVPLRGLDALHPDELVENVGLFDELKSLRMRLSGGATAAKAVAELQGWGGAFTTAAQPTRSRSAASQVPADLRLSDFERLIGATAPAAPSPAADLIARIVGPHIVPGTPPEARAMQKQVEAAMASALRLILHHPDFQAIESAWRTLDLLARSVETDEKLTIDVFDISAAEFAADLAAQDDLARSGIFRILNAPLTEEGGIGFSAAFGLYTFEETPPHAELLGRAARIAAHVQAPFVAAMGPAFLDVPRAERHPLVARAWDELRADPAAAWLGLAAPRFLLRQPYGRRTDPIDAFDFEEFTMAEGLQGMLWCNPAALVAILMARAWKKDGPRMAIGGQMSLGGIPYFVVTDRHGDQVALPCTERNVTTDKAEAIVQRGMMPVISVRGRDVVRLGAFQSLAGQTLAGRWSDNPLPAGEDGEPPARRPDVSAVHRRAPAAAPSPAPATPAEALSDELDALLAGFGDTPAPIDPASIDADLAALLEGL